MKLLLYINSLKTGGAERIIAGLADSMASTGVDVALVTQTSADTDAYVVQQAVRRVTTHTGETSRHPLHALLLNVRRIVRLRKFIRQWQPDRIVAFMPTANFIAVVAASGSGVPVVVAERSFPGAVQLGRVRERLRDWAYRRAQRLVVLTRQTARWYATEKDLHHTVVIPNGVSLPLPSNPPQVDPQSVVGEAPFVVCVARLIESKQLDVVIHTFAALARDFAPWQLVILGEGPLRASLQAQIQQLGLESRCHLPGNVGNVQAWYEAAGVLISASRLEGFPGVLLEAMACGCVPVAYDCPTGPADVIEHGANGLLVPLNDAIALRDGLARLLQQQDLREQLGLRAREVATTFSEDRFLSRWQQLLAEDLSGAGRSQT